MYTRKEASDGETIVVPTYSSKAYHASFASVAPLTPQEFFDHQVQTLVTLGVITTKDADPFVGKVPMRGLSLANFKDFPVSEFGRLMGLIRFKNKTGTSYLAPQYHANLLTPPNHPYLLTGIEDGRARRNVKPPVSHRNIVTERRKGYLTLHGIYHALSFPEVFEDHNMDLVGSRYSSVFFPSLYISAAMPKLNAYRIIRARYRWGAPSCAEWLVL